MKLVHTYRYVLKKHASENNNMVLLREVQQGSYPFNEVPFSLALADLEGLFNRFIKEVRPAAHVEITLVIEEQGE